jgi:hypothetical protein
MVASVRLYLRDDLGGCIIVVIEKRRFLMPRRRGNPNWTTGQFAPIPRLPTAFEIQVRKLGLNEHTCATSKPLEYWCELNRNRCYIPEWLLRHWGLSVDADAA